MNKLVPGALFSVRATREQRLRERRQGIKSSAEPDDCRDHTKSWDRAAEGFMKQDPDGRKLAKLFQLVL